MLRVLHDYLAREAHDWDPKVTAGLGMIGALSPWVDSVTRLLGASALVVGIYCSVSRERRERRAELARMRSAK